MCKSLPISQKEKTNQFTTKTSQNMNPSQNDFFYRD